MSSVRLRIVEELKNGPLIADPDFVQQAANQKLDQPANVRPLSAWIQNGPTEHLRTIDNAWDPFSHP